MKNKFGGWVGKGGGGWGVGVHTIQKRDNVILVVYTYPYFCIHALDTTIHTRMYTECLSLSPSRARRAFLLLLGCVSVSVGARNRSLFECRPLPRVSPPAFGGPEDVCRCYFEVWNFFCWSVFGERERERDRDREICVAGEVVLNIHRLP